MTAAQALQQLREREPIFHRPELGTDYASMITDDFWEIGASGKIYSREFVLSVLAERLANPSGEDVWQASGFACSKPLEEYFLLPTKLWKRSGDTWKIAFHQGTIVS